MTALTTGADWLLEAPGRAPAVRGSEGTAGTGRRGSAPGPRLAGPFLARPIRGLVTVLATAAVRRCSRRVSAAGEVRTGVPRK